MKYLDKIKKFFSNKERAKIIDKIIDDEVLTSAKFGLNIKKKHIEKEKTIIKKIFIDINMWDDILNNIKKYDQYRTVISKIINDYLKKIKYYYDLSKQDVRNKYNCHLDSILSRLMITITNF